MKQGEFELFVKVGGHKLRELVDPQTKKTYIITEPGQEFSLYIVNNSANQYVSIQSIFNGIPLYRKTEGKPGITTHIWHERVNDDEIKPFVFANPVKSSVVDSSVDIHPTIKVILFKATKKDGNKPPFYKSLIGDQDKVASPQKAAAPHVVVTGSPQKLPYSGVSSFVSTKVVIAEFELWTHSSSTLQSMGVLQRCWAPIFGRESESAYMMPPNFSCQFATSPLSDFQPKIGTSDELNNLERELRTHGLRTVVTSSPLNLMSVYKILTGTHNLAFTNYLYTKSHSTFARGLQRFANFYGVPLYIFQESEERKSSHSRSSSSSNSSRISRRESKIITSKNLFVFEVLPKSGQRIWHTGYAIGYLGGDNLVAVEVHDGTANAQETSAVEQVMKEKRLAGIRRQMEELKQQEEALLMPPTPKKLKMQK